MSGRNVQSSRGARFSVSGPRMRLRQPLVVAHSMPSVRNRLVLPNYVTNFRNKPNSFWLRVEQQVKIIIAGLTQDPTALVFLLAAVIFTISNATAAADSDLLSQLISRLQGSEATKALGVFLASQKPLFYAFLWFAVAFFASPPSMKGVVAVFAVTLVYIFHQKKPIEFMVMSLILYSFFKVRDSQVRMYLVAALVAVFYYFAIPVTAPVEVPVTEAPVQRKTG